MAAVAATTAGGAEAAPRDGPQPATTLPVAFVNGRGLRLSGALTLSHAAGAPAAGRPRCAILCHGYAGDKDDMRLPQIARALAAAGVNSLRFDFTGNGKSQGAMRFGNFDGEVDDVAAAKAFLEREHGQEVVGLLGHSKGGDVVILYAARYGDIPRVVNVCGRFVMTEGVKERFGADILTRLEAGPIEITAPHPRRGPVTFSLTLEDMTERMSIDTAAACAQIRAAGRVSLLTVHGLSDATIPARDGRLFAEAVPGSGLVLVEGGDHNFTADGPAAQLVAAAVEFLSARG